MKLSKSKLLILLGVAAIGVVVVADAQSQGQRSPAAVNGCRYLATPPTLADLQSFIFTCDNTAALRVAGSFTPSGTQNVNLTQVLGAAPSLTNPVFVSPATGAIFASAIDQTTPGTTNNVTVRSNTSPVATMNSSSANTGVNAAMTGVFDDTSPTALSENNFGFARMSQNRNLYNTLRDAAGNERGVNVNASNQLQVAVATAAAPTVASITVTSTSGAFLAASTATRYMLCKNESATASIALNFANGTAILNTAGNVTLTAGASIEFSGPFVPTTAITAISSVASSPATCITN